MDLGSVPHPPHAPCHLSTISVHYKNLRFLSWQLSHYNYRIDIRTCLSTFDRVDQHPILSTYRKWAYSPLTCRIIYRDIPVAQKDFEISLLIDAVLKSIGCLALRECTVIRKSCFCPRKIFLYQRSDRFFPLFQPLFRCCQTSFSERS